MSDPRLVDRKPNLWQPEKALSFPQIYDLICRNHPENHVVSREIIACIFFEETLFCNIQQITKNGKGPAAGFGQIQIQDPDKIPFFESIHYNSNLKENKLQLPDITFEIIKNDNDLAVKLTCKYFQWLVSSQGKSLQGALQAQTGGGIKKGVGTEKDVETVGSKNKAFVPLFIEGGKKLEKAITQTWTREAFVEALNFARKNGHHANAIPSTGIFAYTKFWEYIIPDDYLKFGY